MVPKVEVREPINEALQSGRLDTFGTADDAQHPAEVEPGQVTVGGLAGGQVEGEVGRRRQRMRILGQRSHPPGRPLQERDRTRQLGAIAAQDRCADAQHQTHVVVEGQPRHDREIRWGLMWESAKKLRISCSKFTWRLRCEIMTPVGSRVEPELYCRYAMLGTSAVASRLGPTLDVQIQRIDLDDLRSSFQACLIDVIADVSGDRGGGENDRGRRVGKDRAHPLVTRAAMRQRERHRDQPSLHGSQESQDVVEALRGQDHCPVSDRRVKAELACHVHRSAGQLRPRETLGDTRRVVGVVGEGERHVVGPQAGTSVQHRENG